MSRKIYVNEAFRPQRVSGQQRYATEIADRLPDDFRRIRPGRFWGASTLRTWIWVQVVLPLATWRGVLISLTARSPLWHPRQVLVVHDLFVIEHPEWFSRKFELTHSPLLRFQVATTKHLAAVSEPVAEALRPKARGKDIRVIPNAPSRVFDASSAAHADTERVLLDLGLIAGKYLLVVGNLDPRKNLARLAEAYGLLSEEQRADMPLVVVGAGAEIYRRSDIVWPRGAVVTGYLEDPVLAVLYAASKAVVFPSLAEGFGLPIVEAIAAGAPRLLVSDIPVFRWICGDRARYVDSSSIDALAEALQPDRIHGIPSPDLSIRTRFDWSSSATEMSDLACRVASGRPVGKLVRAAT